MRRFFYAIFSCAVAIPLSVSPAVAQSAPQRHLVYSYSIGDQGNQHQMDAEGSGGHGIANFAGGVTDRGTIAVDVLGVESDGGLVVKVSEASQGTRTTKPITCVVYSNTNSLCPPDAMVNPEEMAIIQVLSPQFVDLTKVDSKQHWHIDGSGGSTSQLIDYTIAKNVAGIMQISGDQEIKASGAHPMTSSTTSQISYDDNRVVPLSFKDYTTNRTETPDGYETEQIEIDATLLSDSRKTP